VPLGPYYGTGQQVFGQRLYGGLGAIAAPTPEVTFYPTQGNLSVYYSRLHTYVGAVRERMQAGNRAGCIDDHDLGLFMAARDRWVEFYSAGPSVWFTWLSEDPSKAQAMHQEFLQWERHVLEKCPTVVTPVPAVERPLGTPETVEGLFTAIWDEAKASAGAVADKAGQAMRAFGSGFGSTSGAFGKLGVVFLAFAALVGGYWVFKKVK
jgi:hypothetical protein